jgi:hypothetical protein
MVKTSTLDNGIIVKFWDCVSKREEERKVKGREREKERLEVAGE